MKKPLLQTENRVRRTYRGGRLLDVLSGKKNPVDSFCPEDWISSFVEAKNKDYLAGEGISRVLLDGKEVLITQAVTAEDFGPNRSDCGVLVKYLHSAERLGIQVHPTPAFSHQHFGTNYGKTECWHILGVDPLQEHTVYIGFREGITKERGQTLFEAQDIDGMLSCLHRFEVKVGDTILVKAGTPHAIGAGCFLLEIQEPTDYTMRVEKTTVAGEVLTPMQIHYGVGEDAMLDCFVYEGLSRADAKTRFFLRPRVEKHDMGGKIQTLVSYTNTSCFALQKIVGKASVAPESFVTLIARKAGCVQIGNESLYVKRGEKYFVPYGCGEIVVQNAEIILCYPPKIG